MKKGKFLSVLLAICMIMTMTPFVGLTVFAETITSGDFKYTVLEDGTAEITKYTGFASELTIPLELDGRVVTSIDGWSFSGCTSLTSVNISDSVMQISSNAFGNCATLTSIQVDPANTTYSSENGVLFNKKKTSLICYPDGKSETAYSIPDGVISIEDGAFAGCTSLASVIIPDSVTDIDGCAFEGCTSFTSINIPDSVTRIGYWAFVDCTSLTSITIGNGITHIGFSAFENTGYYNEDSNWENDVLYIGKYLIKAKVDIKGECKIKQGVTVISESAFFNCESLISVTIPDSVTHMGERVFGNCTSLTSAKVGSNVTSIGYQAFYRTSLTSVAIPDSVTSIGYEAFWGCHSLTSITIPDSVTSIGYRAFDGCEKLTIYGFSGSYAETYAKENKIPFVAIKKQEITEEKSNIFVSGVILTGVQLKVTNTETTETSVTYDISLVKDGTAVQPNGNVTVKIPVPENMNAENCKVYRQEADGKYTDMEATYENGFMVFTTDHFSVYVLTTENLNDILGDSDDDCTGHTFGEWVIVKEPTKTEEGLKERVCTVCGEKETEVIPKLTVDVTNPDDTKEPDIPKTGAVVAGSAFAACAMLAMAGATATVTYKKRKNKKA